MTTYYNYDEARKAFWRDNFMTDAQKDLAKDFILIGVASFIGALLGNLLGWYLVWSSNR